MHCAVAAPDRNSSPMKATTVPALSHGWVVSTLVALLLCNTALAAQDCTDRFTCPTPPPEGGRTGDHMLAAGLNALIGGLAGGGIAILSDRPIGRAIVGGAAGGALGYGGKVIAVEQWQGAGFVGRQLGALGASLISNAAEGERPFERILMPVGPTYFVIHPSGRQVHLKVDVPSVLHVAYASVHPSMQMDWNSTLSSGVPVFVDSRTARGHGRYLFGTIVLVQPTGHELGGAHTSRVLRHERVHALQHDFSTIVLNGRLDRLLIPGADRFERHAVLRTDFLIWGGLALILPVDSQPWEREAYFLTP